MKVFISWSGPRSKAAAHILRQWLPDVIQSIEAWMSAEDIDAGARWGSEVTTELAETRCGIICLTKDNQTAPWVLFEAGALSKTIDKTYVIPYLIDLAPSDILPGPLTQFQAKRANRNETWELVRTLNGALDNQLTDEQLKRGFERCWKELEEQLKDLPEPTSHTETRSQGDMLVEVLDEVRRMARAIADDITPHLSMQANQLELIQKLINPAIEISTPSSTIADAIIKQVNSLRPFKPVSSQSISNVVRSKIEAIVRTQETVTAEQLVAAFEPELGKKVVEEIRKMKGLAILTYLEPLSANSAIKLYASVKNPDFAPPLEDDKDDFTPPPEKEMDFAPPLEDDDIPF